MSSSTDSLKKKVCVTVFLDELFEEVQDGTDTEVSRPEPIPTAKKQEPPSLEEDISEDTPEVPIIPRLRKHRRESKFSKNLYESLSSEIERFEFDSNIAVETEKCETDEQTCSDSDFDWEEYLEKTKELGISLNSEDGFRLCKKSQKELASNRHDYEKLEKPKKETTIQKVVDTNRARIRIIVAKSKSKTEEVDFTTSKPLKLKSILDEWTKVGDKAPIEDRHSDFSNETETWSESYSFIFPKDERKIQKEPVSTIERNPTYIISHTPNPEPLLCYASCIEERINPKHEDQTQDWTLNTPCKDLSLLGDTKDDPLKSREKILLDTLIETPRENNHAKGDAIDETATSASDLFSGLGSQEQLLACEEIIKRADELTVETKPKETSNYVAEFRFVKEGFSDGEESHITDIESEMIFADSGVAYRRELDRTDFEDQLPGSPLVKRLKTVEILASEGTDDGEDTSTEIVLVCENVIAEDVSAGAWLSSGSSWQGFCGATSQCFLKDSANSSMYLIEIPLRFAAANTQKVIQ